MDNVNASNVTEEPKQCESTNLVNSNFLKRSHSSSTTTYDTEDYDLASKFLLTEFTENDNNVALNSSVQQQNNSNLISQNTSATQNNCDSRQLTTQTEHRLDQIELRLESMDSKLDSILLLMQEIIQQKQQVPLNRNISIESKIPANKVEKDIHFTPPSLPIINNDVLLALDEKCRSDTYYMEQLALTLISEANVVLLDSKCEKKLVRGYLEILISYDLVENYTLSGAAGFNGNERVLFINICTFNYI